MLPPSQRKEEKEEEMDESKSQDFAILIGALLANTMRQLSSR